MSLCNVCPMLVTHSREFNAVVAERLRPFAIEPDLVMNFA